MNEKMNITVTGGAGYLGSVMIPELLRLGHTVTVVDNFLFRQATLLDCCYDNNLRIIRGDCRDEALMKQATKNADVVIPLAALVGAPFCDRDKVGAQSVNEDAVRMLCEILSPEQRIIYPTTNSGYGVGEKGKLCTEETPLRPISLYGTTKVNAEAAILTRGNCITFRLATVFGVSPRMRLDLLVNDFVYRAFHDRAVVIFEGHFKRNYIHVRDVARAFIHGINEFERMKDSAYNVGLEDANLSKLELCERINNFLPQFVYLEAPIGEDPDKRDYIVSNQKILSTGFVPNYGIDQGIEELMRAYSLIKNSTYANV